MNKDNSEIIDDYGNVFTLTTELSRGGQGVVYRTDDQDYAIKIPLTVDGLPDEDINLKEKFEEIYLLQLPKSIPITLPKSILQNKPGYVMRLLNKMESLKYFSLNEWKKEAYNKMDIPEWLKIVNEKKHNSALKLLHYSLTGSTKLRLKALFKSAAILARLHLSGIIFGDVSQNNIFFLPGDDYKVWLIDADNLRFDLKSGGNLVFTPGLGAPEIMKGEDGSHPYTDSWAFAVMAFQMLSLNHPFEGKALIESDDDDWDSDNKKSETFKNAMDSQGYAIYYPYIDDEDDDSNRSSGGVPRDLVLTKELKDLFQQEFGIGKEKPLARPPMAIWAIALAKAHDNSIVCPNCKMSYFEDMSQLEDKSQCPYCQSSIPAYYKITTPMWSYILQPDKEKHKFDLPHRLFNSFSFEHSDESVCKVIINNKKHCLELDYGSLFPIDEDEINIEFIGGKE